MHRTKRHRTVGAIILAACLSCILGGCSTTIDPVRAYVDAALSVMDGGIYGSTKEWRQAREDALPGLYGSKRVEDTHSELARLVRVAGGPHSSFLTPDELRARTEPFAADADFAVPTVTVLDGIATLTIPAFGSDDPQSNARYVGQGAAAIQEHRADVNCGWIIDVQQNGGGDAFEMLAVASPFLDDGVVMKFVDRDGATQDLVVAGNSVNLDDTEITSLGLAETLKLNTLPIAILQDRATASAGEAVVTAFRGQKMSKSFGQPTAGYSTGNKSEDLSDGSRIIITGVTYVDRLGVIYGGRINPDQRISSTPSRSTNQPSPEEWLRSQCAA